MLLGVLLTFVFGLAVGSFVNVVSLRLPKKGSLFGWSRCPKCNHKLSWKDLIPVFSFLFLGGKCRYCKKSISQQYALVEIATGLLAVVFTTPLLRRVFAGNFQLFDIATFFYFVFMAGALVSLVVTDLRFGILLDKVTFPAIGVALVYNLGAIGNDVYRLYRHLKADTEGLGTYLLQTDYLQNHFWLTTKPFLWALGSGVGLTLFFLLLVVVTKGRGLGWGDVKLGVLIGLLAGWPGVFVAVFASFILGAIASVALMAVKVRKFGQTIPFGPFLVIGTIVGMLWGEEVINWYLGLL